MCLGPYQRHAIYGCAQGIGKLESEMQQLRGNLASFSTTMASLRSIAAAAPSQCVAPDCRSHILLGGTAVNVLK